jgi:spore maturation protein SpmA
MLNYIWLSFLLIAVLVGGFTGKLQPMTTGAFKTAESAVMEIALPLVGIMVIWLGIMRLAERSGLVQIIARVLQPVLRRLFPDIPPEHPAMGAMVMNMAANMLGLGNAATPLGLRAMALLNQLNPRPGVASNAMCTFLTINTASIQLIPTTAIGILAISGAKDATAFVPTAILATVIALSCGVAMSKLLEKLPMFALPPLDKAAPVQASDDATVIEATAVEQVQAPPITPWGKVVLWLFLAAFAGMFVVIAYPNFSNAWPVMIGAEWRFADLFPDLVDKPVMRVVKTLSTLAIPFLLTFFPLYAALRGVKVYEQFTEGAKEAFGVAQRIIPFLVAMLVSIRMLREAGVIKAMTDALGPKLAAIGFPADLLPMVLLRPLSGSATQGIFVDLVKTFGPDALISRMAATIYGSTETTFYVIAVYFGSVAVRQTRHAIIAGLTADTVAVIASIALCRLLFA